MKVGYVKYKVPFIRPDFPTAEELTVDYKAIVSSNWYTNFGPFENKLCQDVTAYIGQSTKVTTVANATIGIDLAIRALFTKHVTGENEVIMPSFTFASGAEVLLSQGYTPVFIDIEQDSWQPSISQAKQYIENNRDRLRGILLCNTFGVGNSEVVEWEKISKQYSLPLVIDSAAGFGSLYPDKTKLGARGDCEIFSLHATKPFGVGEGGLVVSKSGDLIEKIRSLQNFGFKNREITSIGTNGKMQEISCAIGCRQLVGLEQRLASRRDTLSLYKKQLFQYGVLFQDNDDTSTVPFFSALLPKREHVEIAKVAMEDNLIETRSYYEPLHQQAYLNDLVKIVEPPRNTEDIANRIISLPVYDNMPAGLTLKVANVLVDILS